MPCWCLFRLKIKVPVVSRARLLSRKPQCNFVRDVEEDQREECAPCQSGSTKCLCSLILSSICVLAISSFSTRQQQGAGVETSLTDWCAAQTLLDVRCLLPLRSQLEQRIMMSIDPIRPPFQWSLLVMVGPEKAGSGRRRISFCQDLSLHRAPWAVTLMSRKRTLPKSASGGRSRLGWMRKRRKGENKSSLPCSFSWTRSEFALSNRRA